MSARQKSGMSDFAAEAHRLADAYGWAILPAVGKRPHVRRWAHYQRVRPTPKELVDMFSVPGLTGLCVVAGPVSSGLAVRDFDAADSYHRWAADHHDLAAELPTVRTARGFHVLFRAAGISKITALGDGELRGKGISLLPESHHPGGTRYAWLVPPAREIPLLANPTAAGLGRTADRTYKDTVNGLVLPVGQATPEQAVLATLPCGPGERHRKIFALALALKQIDPDLPPAQLRLIVADWHARALPFIRTKKFADSMQDFIRAWACIKSAPLPMAPILDRAAEMPTPPHALHYPPPIQKLVRVCAALQEQWQDRPFFLSVRKAAEIMGAKRDAAWRAMQELQFDGVLREEKHGTLRGRRASQWRYFSNRNEVLWTA